MDPDHCTHPGIINDIVDRHFDTSAYADYASNPEVYRYDPERLDWLYVECPNSSRCPECGHRPGHSNSIVIAVDGACRNNGTEDAEAAYAAYFTEFNTTYNTSSLLAGLVQTNQRAELTAGLLALNLAYTMKNLNDPSRVHKRLKATDYGPEASLAKVVIKSDTEYLVKDMTS